MKLEHLDRLHAAELELLKARRAAHDPRFHQVMPSLAAVLQPLTDGLHEIIKAVVEDAAPEGYFALPVPEESAATGRTWEIWIEGYAATGQTSTATKLGEAKGATFKEACERWVEAKKRDTPDFNNQYGEYDPEHNTIWGCRLHSNEPDARRVFG